MDDMSSSWSAVVEGTAAAIATYLCISSILRIREMDRKMQRNWSNLRSVIGSPGASDGRLGITFRAFRRVREKERKDKRDRKDSPHSLAKAIVA